MLDQERKRARLLFLALCLCLALASCSKRPEQFAPEATAAPAAMATARIRVHDDEELTAVLTADELAALGDSYPCLRYLDVSGSDCYDEILAYIAAHPEVETVYTVEILGGGEPLVLRGTQKTLALGDVSYVDDLIRKAPYLPELLYLELPGDEATAAQLEALRGAYPDAEVSYPVALLGRSYLCTAEEVELTGLTPEDIPAVTEQLKKLPALRSVRLADGAEAIPDFSELRGLMDSLPAVAFDLPVELFGQTVSTAAERLEFEKAPIGNDGMEQLRALLPYLRNLSYLKLDSCGVDNEVLAQLRDDFPAIKVVWRVFFGEYNCLTDTEMIWATGTVTDGQTGVLQYCTDVKYLDLGHNCITNIDFVRYMPKLEVAVLAITWLRSVEPLENCPNLEYLELFSTRVTDFSPLAKCTHLQHLNVSHSVDTNNLTVPSTDISCLYDLPELRRFYCTMCYVPQEQKDEMIARHPDCEIEFGWVDPAEGAWRFDADGERNERYALLCEQFGYDSLQQSGKMWSLY